MLFDEAAIGARQWITAQMVATDAVFHLFVGQLVASRFKCFRVVRRERLACLDLRQPTMASRVKVEFTNPVDGDGFIVFSPLRVREAPFHVGQQILNRAARQFQSHFELRPGQPDSNKAGGRVLVESKLTTNAFNPIGVVVHLRIKPK